MRGKMIITQISEMKGKPLILQKRKDENDEDS